VISAIPHIRSVSGEQNVNEAQDEPRDEPFDEVGEFDIPVRDAGGERAAGQADVPAKPDEAADWTRTESVRDDPESLGDEARKLWDAVLTQFVEPVVRSYPEAATHLSNAGAELASAVRSLIRGSEQLWAGSGPTKTAEPSTTDVVEVLEDEAPEDDGTE
jgi:Family of unknown function (DUF5304)